MQVPVWRVAGAVWFTGMPCVSEKLNSCGAVPLHDNAEPPASACPWPLPSLSQLQPSPYGNARPPPTWMVTPSCT